MKRKIIELTKFIGTYLCFVIAFQLIINYIILEPNQGITPVEGFLTSLVSVLFAKDFLGKDNG